LDQEFQVIDYDLPPHLIAQEPPPRRDQARLLVVRRTDGALANHIFADLPELLDPGDLLVLNDTRVLAARLLGRRQRTGGRWEGLFLRCLADGSWEVLCQTRGRLIEGETIVVEPGSLKLGLETKTATGTWRARPGVHEDHVALLSRHGQVPLPPYIRKGRANEADRERYQTVYAHQTGAVAAPTAGLHFTPEVFERLRQRGIGWAFVTLHVGLGTFQPIQVENWTQHKMHAEWGQLPAQTASAITACQERGGRVVAVGTSTVRLLETASRACSAAELPPWSGDTELFIYPSFQFRIVDALVTNFHLPRSTLLLLVGAFAGVDLLRQAYTTAIEEEYRFFSYGDAMLLL
jgi:S-adenosylmethionine:tRNA ribosyltransferase-isomerase